VKQVDGLVVLTFFDWDGIWHGCQFYARGLAASGWPTLYVEPRPLWNTTDPVFNARALRQAFLGSALRAAGPNLHVLRPRALPFGSVEAIRRLSQRLFRHDVHAACAALGISRPVYSVAYYEHCVEDLQLLGADRVLYRCIDDIQNDEEQALCRGADLVFVCHRTVFESKRPLNRHAHLLPNGCDFEQLTRLVIDDSIFAGIPRPRVGMSGMLDHWVNYAWLLALARHRPDVSLVLIGPVRRWRADAAERSNAEAFEALRSLPNVHWVGEKLGDEFTAALRALDVALIAFTDTPFNRGRDPLKLYQYLAVGLPMVTSPLSGFPSLPPGVLAAHTAEEFCNRVDEALTSGAKIGREARIDFARESDWRGRVRAADALLRQQFALITPRTVASVHHA
jgi:glycosyltransferase involved in cell wall biosynthesis